jgi:hypothetical protein
MSVYYEGKERHMPDSRRQIQSQSSDDNTWTYDDGWIVFHDDGSTTVNITVPAGRGGTGEIQYDRLVKRLLEIANSWVKSEEDTYLEVVSADG